MTSNPVWHNIFRYIVLKPDNITFEADNYKDTISILRGPGVAWQGTSSLDTSIAPATDQFMINVDYDISVPLATTDITLEDVNGNTSSITFTAGRGVEILRNSAQELEWRSYSVTETDTLQTVTERNNITNNKIFVNDIEVGTISSSFTEDGFPSYDAGHNLIGDGTLDDPLKFSPLYQDSLIANSSDQFKFTALGPGVLAYSASYVFDTGATTGSVTLEREDPSSPGTWVTLDIITGITQGYSYAIQGTYAELYNGNVNYRLTYSWTGNLGVITWHVYNTFEGGAYTPINNPQLKTDTTAKTVNINDLQFFQNNIRTTVSNTDIVLDPAGTGKVVALSNITAPTFTGNLTGNVTGNITGNVISTNTSLTIVDTSGATTIFTGNLTGNADTVTNGVYTTGSYADPTWITSLNGTKIINGVLTTGSYADPSWITSLDAAKIIGDIQLRSFVIDDSIRIDGTLIETIVSNANLELRANGTGVVYISDGLTVTDAITFNTTTNNQSYTTTGAGTITITSGTLGSINNMSIGQSTAAAGTFTSLTATSNNVNVTLSPTGTGSVTINPATAGTINNMSIGATTASAGTFTSLTATSNNVNITLSPTGTGTVTINPDTAGTINNMSIGATTAAAGTFTTLTATSANVNVTLSPTGTGTVTISPAGALTINPTTASTMNNVAIGGSTAAAGTFTTLTATSANVNVTLSPTGTGTVTINPATAGNINNMNVGASTRGTGAFTTLDANSTVGLSPSNAAVTISPTGTGSVTINPAAASTMNNVTITVPAGTTTVAPFKMTSGNNLTSVTAGTMEYDGTVVSFTTNTNIGRAPLQQIVFTSGISASNGVTIVVGTNYAIFPTANDTITLPVGTYMVETAFRVDTAAAVNNVLSFTMLGAGGATCTFIGQASATNAAALPGATTQTRIASAAANAITAAVATATQRVVFITGVLRVTVQGTIIPSIQFNGLAGAMTFYADNYMVISPLSNSGSTASTGGWG